MRNGATGVGLRGQNRYAVHPLNPKPLTVGLVVLTTGNRSDELKTIMIEATSMAFDSRVLVGNGSRPPDMDGWNSVETPDNLGVPAGRAFGVEHCKTDIVVFLDDDSRLPPAANSLVAAVRQVFTADPTIGALGFRVVVTGTDETLRRWSPRPTKSPPSGLTDVPTFPGNGHALRREAFESIGGYLNELFFKHEETELSWRLLDAGWRVVTDPSIVVEHPYTTESRHEHAIELGLRNKVWMSRMRLPLIPAILGAAVSTARSLSHCRSLDDVKAVARGVRAGFRTLPGPRTPISWSTVIKLTRSGRPPIF